MGSREKRTMEWRTRYVLKSYVSSSMWLTPLAAYAVSLVAITLVSTTALAVVHRQQQATELARQREAQERKRAETDLAAAQDTVDRILTRVSSDRLGPLPKNEPIRTNDRPSISRNR